jgi:hypothetical protein
VYQETNFVVNSLILNFEAQDWLFYPIVTRLDKDSDPFD